MVRWGGAHPDAEPWKEVLGSLGPWASAPYMPGTGLHVRGATTDKEVVGLLRRRTMTSWYEAPQGSNRTK